MVANELRLGNYVLKDGKNKIITPFSLFDVYAFPSHFKPIPLTEEILLKCASKSIYSKTRFDFDGIDNGQFHVDTLNDRFVFRGLGMSIVYVDTLHHLQNIYFSVKGKELEINL